MIPLKDLFTLLATGEFSNLSLSKDRSGNIEERDYEKIITNLNLGVVELFKRFKLQDGEINLHADPSVLIYYLRNANVTPLATISTTQYLETPLGYPGALNLIEITGITDTDGNDVRLNNRFAIPTIRQLAFDTLKITDLEAKQIFVIHYQSFPPQIVLDKDFDLANVTLDIPQTVLEPLLYYVAARVYKPIGSNSSGGNASQDESFMQKYELACQKIETFGLEIDDCDRDLDRFSGEGWV